MKFCKYRLVLLYAFVLALCITKVQGQSLFFRSVDVEWNNEPVKVKVLHQDRKGYIWLGTSHGLFRYNGFSYELFPVDTDSIGAVSVTAIHEDMRGRLWVGHENGLLAITGNKKLAPVNSFSGRISSSISAILYDDQEVLWVATYGEGVYYRKDKKVHHISTKNGLPDDYTYALAQSLDGSVWVGTDRGIGICNLTGGKPNVQALTTRQGLPDNIVTVLAASPDGDMWVGTQSAGVSRYNQKKNQFLHPLVNREWSYGSVTALSPDRDGVWVGTEGGGALRLDKHKPGILTGSDNAEHANLNITDLLTDKEGNLWLANNTGRILITDPTIKHVTQVQGKPVNNVRAVLATKDNSLWYATDKGLFRWAKENKTDPVLRRFLDSPSYRELKIISLYQDDWGFIWVGTFEQGAFRLDPKTGHVLPVGLKEGLVNENILSITGKGNRVWLATLGGVSLCQLETPSAVMHPGFKFQNFTHENALGINYIYQAFIDSKDRVWFATDGKGLTMLQNGKFYNFSEKDGIKSKTVYSVIEDAAGAIWFSTSNAGIYRYDGQTFRNYGLKEGIRDLNITSLKADNKGHILLMHQQGIDLLHPKTGRVLHYDKRHGISNPDADLNNAAIDQDGVIWFGTQNGFISYHPEFLKSQYQPITRLQDVQVFFNSVLKAGQSEFKHDSNHLTFEYVGLWYESPEEVTYRLMLEGYDRGWTNSRNHAITYPNLPPGDYVFKVSAAAGTDFSNADVVEYPFSIAPPFWKTYWFYLLVFTLAALGLYLFIKAREKRLKRAERLEKDKVMFQFETLKSQVNPHFLFNSFNTLISTIENDPEAAVVYVEKLSDFFREMLVHREKDVITLGEELELIQNYYFLQQKRYGSNLVLHVSVHPDALDYKIAPLTLQLLLENAIKHNVISKSRPLTIEIFSEEDSVTVRNKLQLKQTQEASTKVGLQNIRSRYQILSSREVEIAQTGEYYQVRIPLLKRAENERIAY